MTFEDRYVSRTPEGVSLHLVLAGLGSRFAAYLLDFLIGMAFFVVVVAGVDLTVGYSDGTGAEVWAAAITLLAAMFSFIGYFVLCEMVWAGRSVGKVAAGTRVVRVSGAPVGFWSSLLRNVARLIDWLPFPLYVVGSISVLATSRNQRLGDLLGDTLVVRVRQAAVTVHQGIPVADPRHWAVPVGTTAWAPAAPPGYGAAGPAPPGWGAPGWGASALPPELAHWDVSAVQPDELALVRQFLANRWGYTPEARARLALQLADRIWPEVAGPTVPPHPEAFLEAVLLVKSVRG